MLDMMAIMALTSYAQSGIEGACEELGKSKDELFEDLTKVHESMNEAGRAKLVELDYEFTEGGEGTWTGAGAGMLSLLYLMHAKTLLEARSELSDDDSGSLDEIQD